MKDPIDALHHPADRPAIHDIAAGPLEFEVRQVIEARAAAGQQAQVVTTRGERADDVRADEPAPAGDQSLAHVPMVEAAGRRSLRDR